MKPAFLFAMPAEASSLVPKLIAARDAGVKVLVVGGDPGDEKAYDSVMMMNQYLAGSYEAYMAKQWVDRTYPDAADGSIETAILESTLNTGCRGPFRRDENDRGTLPEEREGRIY